ncbi:MAG: citramalate synthase [Clostridiales bacterium]|jgi:2-isopropylmalate synthase|nr:citramalate synthase [Clostridiales bacterium]
MTKRVEIYDSTLRDGAQAVGISFSAGDKLKIAKALAGFGVDYVEGGNPFASKADAEFFRAARSLELGRTRLAAFGATRRRGVSAGEDPSVRALLDADTPVCAVFGKAWDFHAVAVLGAGLDENLTMIADTVAFLKSRGKTVVFDAEHFFDGYKDNPEYALRTVRSAAGAGADVVCLCDTNGGAFPDETAEMTAAAVRALPGAVVGIHAHNDGGMAVANSVMAVEAGARQVQGTFTGFGERCGNASLSQVIANLQLKRGCRLVPDASLPLLTQTARFVAEVANVALSGREPFVGRHAFSHKAGMHIDGVRKNPRSFEHVPPEAVGNERRLLTSESSGRSAVLPRVLRVCPSATRESPETEAVLRRLKELTGDGYQFEGAEATFELVARKTLGLYRPFFEVRNFKVITEQLPDGRGASVATIKIAVDGREEITADEGEGPVNALDKALRKALGVFYPSLGGMRLTDYKVRVLDGSDATAAKVRVLIESADGADSWTTVGVSKDIIEASLIALVDSVEYKLMKETGG